MNLQDLTFDALMDRYDETLDYGYEQTAIEAELRRRVTAAESLRSAINDLAKAWTDRASQEEPNRAAALALCAVELKSILSRSGQFQAVKEVT